MSAKFYFYPDPPGTNLEVIDVGEDLAEFYSEMIVLANDAIGFDGSISRSVGSIREVYTIIRDRMKLSEELAHRFRSLQNHLDRGGSCGFSANSNKCFCGFTKQTETTGSSVLQISGNPFYNMTTNNSISVGDYITITTNNPGLYTETRKVTAVNIASFSQGGSLTISPPLSFTYPKGSFVHYYRFIPTLKRPLNELGKNVVNNEHGQLWSLDINLVVDTDLLFSFVPSYDSFGGNEITQGSNKLYGVLGVTNLETITNDADHFDPNAGGAGLSRD